MNHVKPFKIYEAVDTATELTFKTYVDKMSIEDRLKMDSILEKNPRGWSDAEKAFMKRMSMKNVTLYIGSDGNTYTAQQVKDMGYNPDRLSKPKPKNSALIPETRALVGDLNMIMKKLREMSKDYSEEYEFIKVSKPLMESIDSSIYRLSKLI